MKSKRSKWIILGCLALYIIFGNFLYCRHTLRFRIENPEGTYAVEFYEKTGFKGLVQKKPDGRDMWAVIVRLEDAKGNCIRKCKAGFTNLNRVTWKENEVFIEYIGEWSFDGNDLGSGFFTTKPVRTFWKTKNAIYAF